MKKWKEVSEDERSLQDCHTDPHSQRLELSLSLSPFLQLPSLPTTPPPLHASSIPIDQRHHARLHAHVDRPATGGSCEGSRGIEQGECHSCCCCCSRS